jgi:hypothetical protein
VRALVDAFASSSEETIFGNWLEGLAVFVSGKVDSGWKSGIAGLDLEFDRSGIRYIVSIKSGPNWGNAPAIRKMKTDFLTAQKTLRTSNSGLQVVCVNGCCYGRDNRPDKGAYFKYCGQRFWAFIGGSETLYTDIVEPLGFQAKAQDDAYMAMYSALLNRFTREFIADFCTKSGVIDWRKLVEFNAGTLN